MCFGSKDEDPGAKRNQEIEKQLRADQKKLSREVKLLLLGAGESGKSTVLKQMRLIYAAGFSNEERRQWRVVIFNNLLVAFQVILKAMEEQEVAFSNPSNAKYSSVINADQDIASDEPFPMDCLEAFKALWVDQGVQTAIDKGAEYALHDNLTYFFSDVDRIWARNFVPTDQDILRARLRTTGISETIFDLGNLTYKMFDVGGQRSERKKWIHCFDNVQVVLFLAAISGYDHALLEDRNGNQMHEALLLFDSISNSKWFERSAIILFLNKMDLFKAKIESRSSPVSAQFSDYTGPEGDVMASREFFANKFRRCVRSNKEIYVHYTNATDTDLLKKTMTSVQDDVVQKNLQALIL